MKKKQKDSRVNAQVRGTRRAGVLSVFVLLAGLAFCPPLSFADRPADYGKQWVRSHPMALTALVTNRWNNFAPGMYKQSGQNITLCWERELEVLSMSGMVGLPWIYHVQGDGSTTQTEIQNAYNTNPGGCSGWLVFDEPSVAAMPTAKTWMDWIKANYPGLVYSECASNVDQAYLDNFTSILDPDILVYNIYPFRTGGVTLSNIYAIAKLISDEAKSEGIPYWVFVQAFGEDDSNIWRVPSESDLRMQIFMHLTYGFTGISYYSYEDASGHAMVDSRGMPRPIYSVVQSVSPEVANLGYVLRYLTNTAARYVPGKVGAVRNSPPSGITNWASGLDPYITNIDLDFSKSGNEGLDKNGLFGSFVDDNGNHYFMVTNVYHGPDLTADQTKLDFVVEFAPSITEVVRYNRLTGQKEAIPLTDHKLQVSLPGGTGDLFRYSLGYSTPELVVSPSSRRTARADGQTTFAVVNDGGGTMNWTAAVTAGSSWLSIVSGGSGTDNGTVTVSFTENTTGSDRTGTVRITATAGAIGSPRDVTVVQSAQNLRTFGLYDFDTSSMFPLSEFQAGITTVTSLGAGKALVQTTLGNNEVYYFDGSTVQRESVGLDNFDNIIIAVYPLTDGTALVKTLEGSTNKWYWFNGFSMLRTQVDLDNFDDIIQEVYPLGSDGAGPRVDGTALVKTLEGSTNRWYWFNQTTLYRTQVGLDNFDNAIVAVYPLTDGTALVKTLEGSTNRWYWFNQTTLLRDQVGLDNFANIIQEVYPLGNDSTGPRVDGTALVKTLEGSTNRWYWFNQTTLYRTQVGLDSFDNVIVAVYPLTDGTALLKTLEGTTNRWYWFNQSNNLLRPQVDLDNFDNIIQAVYPLGNDGTGPKIDGTALVKTLEGSTNRWYWFNQTTLLRPQVGLDSFDNVIVAVHSLTDGTALLKTLESGTNSWYWFNQSNNLLRGTVGLGDFDNIIQAVHPLGDGSALIAVGVPGDVNGDGVVNATDLSQVLTAMDATASTNNWNANADLDHDGEVTSTDLATVLLNLP